MRNFKNVDFIIRGDAEIPLLNLMDGLSKGAPGLSSVPNLTWRNGTKVIHNEQNYVADEADINKLSFSNFELMENFATYTKIHFDLFDYSGVLLNRYNTFFLCVGRGCSATCSFCGGSRLSHKIISARTKPVFRSAKNVLATTKDAARAGIDCIYVSFDPEPKRNYYLELFRLIRIHKIDISLVFECWGLPTVKFIEEFKKTFGRGKYSKIVLSPETACERLRKLNKGFFYTNTRLLSVLGHLKKRKIFTDVYFTYPLPCALPADIESTLRFIELIKQRFGCYSSVCVQGLELDPASAMFIYPERYNIVKKVKSFSGYCDNKIKRKFIINGLEEKRLRRIYRKLANAGRPDKLLYWGWTQFSLKRYGEVIKAITKAIDEYRDIGLYLLLAACYEENQENNMALKTYKEALKVFSGERSISIRLAKLYLKLQYYKDKQ